MNNYDLDLQSNSFEDSERANNKYKNKKININESEHAASL